MYLNLGPLTPKQNHASRPTGHPGQEHTVFATYSSDGKMPIHAQFAISELLYNNDNIPLCRITKIDRASCNCFQ